MSSVNGNSNNQASSEKDTLKDLKKQKKEELKKLKSEKFDKKQKSVNFKAKVTNNPKPSTPNIQKIEYTSKTLLGDKKDTNCSLPDKYSSSYVEAAWYPWWQKMGYFKPEYKFNAEELANLPNDKKFVVLIPPPNVTGTLHIGHALMCSLQDILCRWNRMHGKAVLWNPGCDHAGIATQVVVEKMLKREKNLTRHDLGREKFIEEVWNWKKEKGVKIYEQMKRLGISVDWEREYFTMDPPRSQAVIEAFVRLYDEKLIYRAKRLVSWSCALKSAISDIEVEKLEINGRTLLSVPNFKEKVEFGLLVKFAYKITDSDEKIVVATTRIETMLGDVAVAVHPDDTRYKNLIGKQLDHPFCSRKLLIVGDTAVDPTFGTGAVKVTPGHDQIDFEIGERHKLKMINIFDQAGYIDKDLDVTSSYTHFRGIHRFEGRKAVLEELKKCGLFVETTDHSMVVPICSRSKDIIEPIFMSQWYISCEKMATKAIKAVDENRLKIIPHQHVKTWYYWMKNIKDWCISRQLWWGHRIPAYHVSFVSNLSASNIEDPHYWVVGRSKDEAIKIAVKKFNVPEGDIILKEDDDVLDTWFSSGILPFSVFGWPEKTNEFKSFFPTTFLETGYDILFFWVARMVMLSEQLTGELPFPEIFLHSIVRDSHGRKMSKSLGNIIDPVDVIEGIALEELNQKLISYNLDPLELEKATKGQKKDFPSGIPECGSDALRFALCAYSGSVRDINLDILRVQGYRFFCNKIWNANRFCLMNFGPEFQPKSFSIDDASLCDKWILSRLSFAEQLCNSSFSSYDFSNITTTIYNFWLYEFCDIYIESAKTILYSNDEEKKNLTRNVIFTCIDNGLRLLHPLMPFITEELYQRLPFPPSHFKTTPSICISQYPHLLPWRNELIETNMEAIISLIKLIRSSKDDYLPSKTKTEIFIHPNDDSSKSLLKNYLELMKTLTNASQIKIVESSSNIPHGCAVAIDPRLCHIYILLTGLIDIPKEIKKIEEKIETSRKNLSKLRELCEAPDYANRVPQAVQESNSLKDIQLKDELEKLSNALKNIKMADS